MTAPSLNSWDALINQEQYDQPPSDPHTTYLVCSLPRSGSSLFCDRLYHAGYGVPSEYWFSHLPTAMLVERWGASSAADYLSMLPTRRSLNGIFGMKTHWQQYKRQQWEWGRPDIHFKGIKYIRLYRRDLERQAVSWWVAAVTDYWNDVGNDPQPTRLPPCRFEDVEKLHRSLVVQQECWDNFLSHHDFLDVVFEDFVDDQEACLRRVAGFLQADPPGALTVPLIRKMQIPGVGDLVNEYREWRVINAE